MAKRTDAVVIGAGAAGLICAGFAARRGKSVIVLEKMDRPARKLMITGKGRCNLTNNCGRDELLASVKTNGRFMYSAFSAFSPQDVMCLFEDLGVPLKTERGNRVFPVSDRSADIVAALVRFAKDAGAVISTRAGCESVMTEDGKVTGVKSVGGEIIYTDAAVIAAGGASYPATGSDGDGYTIAKELGHAVSRIRPSLIPVVTKEEYCRDLMGLSLKNCTLTLTKKGVAKPIFKELGEMMFTHFGISGPLVLSASSHMDGDISDWSMSVDLKPALTPEQLDARLLRDFDANINKDFFNSLGGLLPRKLIPVIVRLSGIDGAVKVNRITKGQRRSLAALLKALPITPSRFRPIEEAVITSGGVDVKEINPKTMESKLVSGLYFAGEVIDVDAYTGGFNLQIAFSTGYLAAQNI